MDVKDWLNSLGLGQYAAVFEEQEIDAEALRVLTVEDLQELGVPIGHRKKLFEAIAKLQPGVRVSPEELSPVGMSGERRQVTVLFADLTGYTKLSTELGAEETHYLLNRYFETVDGILDDYGAALIRHIGDGIMAVFGAPVAHTNDPERALRAALDIHRTLEDVSKAVGRELLVHIGIASGEVVASAAGSSSHHEYSVTGDSVNLASRLQDKAGPGETLISDLVYQAVSAYADCTALGEVTVKGFDEPIRIWRAEGLGDTQGGTLEIPFVGRNPELRQFQALAEECRETGAGKSILVRGDEGIGKTRLIEEFARIAVSQGYEDHKGLILDFGAGKGQDAIRSLLRSLLGIPLGGGEQLRRERAEHAITTGAIEDNQRMFLYDLLDLALPADLVPIYDAMGNKMRIAGKQQTVNGIIAHASRRNPTLLRVEDLHWADGVTLAFLAAIARTVDQHRVVLVMTTRIEGDPLDRAWRADAGGSPLTTLDLGLLRETEAIEFARAFVESTSRYVGDCIDRAQGNPFFLEQLLRNADERRGETMPPSIRSLVLARMDQLPDEDKSALQAASVIGQRFSPQLHSQILEVPRYDYDPLIKHCLVRAEGDDLIFAHALLKDGVYASLLQHQRRDLHQRVAEYFADTDLALSAQHLDRAGSPKAAEAYLAAARGEAESYRYVRCRQLLESGLKIATDAASRLPLLLYYGTILRELGSAAESIAAFEEAIGLAGEGAERCQAWIGMARSMRIVERLDEALDILDRAQAMAESSDLFEELAEIHHLRGNLFFPRGNIDGCLEEHARSLEYARRVASPEAEARALGGLGDAYYLRGRMATACEHFERCVALSRAHGLGDVEVAHLLMLGQSRLYLNDFETALADTREAAVNGAKIGQRRAELIARISIGWILRESAELAAAQREWEAVLQTAQDLGARRFEPLCYHHLAYANLSAGRRQEALAMLEQAMVISRETGPSFAGPTVLGAIALFSDDRGRVAAALSEGDEILAKGAVGHGYFRFYRDAMDALLRLGDWDGVERYATALEEFTSQEPLPYTSFYIARGRALAALGRGEQSESLFDELRRLLEEANEVGFKAALPSLERAIAS